MLIIIVTVFAATLTFAGAADLTPFAIYPEN